MRTIRLPLSSTDLSHPNTSQGRAITYKAQPFPDAPFEVLRPQQVGIRRQEAFGVRVTRDPPRGSARCRRPSACGDVSAQVEMRPRLLLAVPPPPNCPSERRFVYQYGWLEPWRTRWMSPDKPTSTSSKQGGRDASDSGDLGNVAGNLTVSRGEPGVWRVRSCRVVR